MRAVIFAEFGGPEVLRLAQVDEPHAGPAEVRVRVKTVGVNPLDWKIRSGTGPFPVELPYIGGLEVAGVVDEVGEGVTAVSIGDEVLGLTPHGLADFAVLTTFARKPAALTWDVAAAMPVAIETASRTLRQLALTPGQTLLVHGAAGSVGSAAVQLAVAGGATVIGTARTPEQLELVRRLGATPVLSTDVMLERVRAAAPNGVDVALDCAGNGALADLVALAGTPSAVVTVADLSAREYGVRFSAGGVEPDPDDLREAAELASRGEFFVPVGRSFSIHEAAQAQRLSQQGGHGGKLVIAFDKHA